MCGIEKKRSYDFFKKNLLSKLENGRSKNFFLHANKNFFPIFFSLIPVKTFKKEHKEPVFNLTWFFFLVCTNS